MPHLDGRRWCLAAVCCLAGLAQDAGKPPAAAPDWQIAAGGPRAFEVVSVKLDSGPFRPPNFPLDPGDAYRPVGGRFSADFPVSTYIAFAYKLSLSADQRQAMLAHLPDWVATDRYAIEARSEGNPTKDQMRLMMQSLLAERFHFAAHFETRTFPALGLGLVKPGKTGPNLRPHSEGVPCEATPATNDPIKPGGNVFPPVCDVVMMTINRDQIAKGGSRNTTMTLLAGALPGMGRLDHAVVDQTGLTGRFDFTIEFAPEPNRAAEPTADPAPELRGPGFIEALREQLGLKLEATKAPLPFLVIERVERPTGN
jgi:uncharacterized protein (TIGR03435 family)